MVGRNRNIVTMGSMFLMSLLIMGTGCSSSNSGPAVGDMNVVTNLQVEKQKAEDMVTAIKAKYKDTNEEYKTANGLYDDAQRRYNAYIDALLDSIKFNTKSDLSQSATSAGNAAKKFQDYVESQTKTRSPLGAVGIADFLITVATKAYDAHRTMSNAQRNDYVNAVKPRIQWLNWAQIKS